MNPQITSTWLAIETELSAASGLLSADPYLYDRLFELRLRMEQLLGLGSKRPNRCPSCE